MGSDPLARHLTVPVLPRPRRPGSDEQGAKQRRETASASPLCDLMEQGQQANITLTSKRARVGQAGQGGRPEGPPPVRQDAVQRAGWT